MNKDELMKLVNAGFSKDDIMNLLADEPEVKKEEASEETSEEVLEEKVNTSESKEVDVNTFTDTFNEMLKRMNDSVDGFTKKVQEFNINNAQMQGDTTSNRSIDDIFNDIILPKND